MQRERCKGKKKAVQKPGFSSSLQNLSHLLHSLGENVASFVIPVSLT